MAVVIPRAVPEIEVAVSFALLARFTTDTGEQLFALIVVALVEAFRIIVVDEAIVIVVQAVATECLFPSAEDGDTLAIAAAGPNACASPTRTSSAIHACGSTDPCDAARSRYTASPAEGVTA
jgi:hypothetical protein